MPATAFSIGYKAFSFHRSSSATPRKTSCFSLNMNLFRHKQGFEMTPGYKLQFEEYILNKISWVHLSNY